MSTRDQHVPDGDGNCVFDGEPMPCTILKVFDWLDDPEGGKEHRDEMYARAGKEPPP